MTPTQQAICRVTQELYGVSEEETAAAFASGGPPGVGLVESGLLSPEQADQVLEQAFSSLSVAASGASSGGALAPAEALDEGQSEAPAEFVPGLGELLARIQAVVDGEIPIAVPGVLVRDSLPPIPDPRPATALPLQQRYGGATLRDVDPAADEAAILQPPPVARQGGVSEIELQARLTDDAVARWALAEKDVSPEALARARAHSDSLVEALVETESIELWEATEVLEGCGDVVCGSCRSRFTLGDQLISYGRDCPCPKCGSELGIGGNDSATVSLPPPEVPKPASLTSVPDYAGSLGGQTAAPEYADENTPTRPLDGGPVGLLPQEGLSVAVGGLANYELLGELARGGMGIVYKARQRGLKRIVCLKVMRSAELASADDRRRFLREAEASARLNHPGIVPIHEVGEHNGQCFFSMDFIEGRELGHHARQLKPSVRELVEIMVLVCDAIHYAHQRGIIHRDLKPANIMIDADLHPHVMDFGIAKRLDTLDDDSKNGPMTQEGEIMGTPHYMAPEQAEGKVSEIDVRSDVYALGVICYELLTGKRPFSDDNILRLIKKVVNDDPASLRFVRPDLDPDLETIVLKAMEKEKQRRYQTALGLKEELERWLQGEAIEARRATVIYRTRKWASRNKWVAISLVGGAFGIALILGMWAAVWAGRALQQDREVAHLVNAGEADLLARRYEQAFNRFGRALSVDPASDVAKAGRVDAALAWAKEAVSARRPGEAETVLRQVEYLGLRTGAVELAIADAQSERRRQVEVGVERQQRFVEETHKTLSRLEQAVKDRELPIEEQQAFVFDLVGHRDPETVAILRAVVAESERGARSRAVVARALGWMREVSAVAELATVVNDHTLTLDLVYAAAEALGRIGGEDAWRALLDARESRGREFRRRTQLAMRQVASGLDMASAGEGDTGDSGLFARADRLRQGGDHAAAVDSYGEALDAAPEAIGGHLGRALSCLALGRLELAESDLDRVVQGGGASADVGLLNRAEVRRRRGNVKGALADLEALLRQGARADAYLAKGRILLGRGEATQALIPLTKAVQLQEEYGDAHASRAEAYLASGRLDDALSDATLALQAEAGRAGFRMIRARVHFARGEFAAAEEDALRAAEFAPSQAAAYHLQAKLGLRRGAVNVALRVLSRGFQRTGADAFRLERVRVLLGVGRAQDASGEASQILAEASEGAPVRVPAQMFRGVAALALGDPQAAAKDLRAVIEAAPLLAAAHYNLACALAKGNEPALALDALERAVKLGQPAGAALRADSDLATLHGQARFEALAKEE